MATAGWTKVALASIIHLAALHPHTARLRKRMERKLRPVRPSRAVELWYREQLGMLVDQLRKAGDEIASHLRTSWPHVHDATAPRLPALIDEAARKFGGIDRLADRLAGAAAIRSLGAVDERLAGAIRDSVGVDVTPLLSRGSAISAEMARATEANVALITSIPPEYLDLVRDAVTKGFETGLRWESIAERIKEIGDITDRRAKVIARDQAAKMTSSFARVRQTGLGIKGYIWSGAMDQRERASHRALEGTRQRWDAPPLVDGENVHPGEAILCRCVASPVFDLDDVGFDDVMEARAA